MRCLGELQALKGAGHIDRTANLVASVCNQVKDFFGKGAVAAVEQGEPALQILNGAIEEGDLVAPNEGQQGEEIL